MRETRRIGRHEYELVLDHTPGQDWPWMVNAYRLEPNPMGFKYPVRFVAGKTSDDAIERVSDWIEANI